MEDIGKVGELACEEGLPKRERRADFWSVGRLGSWFSGGGMCGGGVGADGAAGAAWGLLKRFSRPCECPLELAAAG